MPIFTKPVLSIFALSTLLYSCNEETAGASNEPIPVKIAPPVEDSILAVMRDTAGMLKNIPASIANLDSMMQIVVKLPPFFDEKAYDQETIRSFETLAGRTGGAARVVSSPDMLDAYITKVVSDNNADYGDVLFLIDNTGSMDDDIAEIKSGLGAIIGSLKQKKNVRLAVATYRDKLADSTKWFSFRNFETDLSRASVFIDSIVTNDGGDRPESVYEAYFEAEKKNFWRSSSKRIVLIIGDAPPHTKPEGAYTLDDMVRQAGKNNIKVNFFPLIITPYSAAYHASDGGPQPFTPTRLIGQIFPNPSNSYVNVQFDDEERYRIEVFTISGLRIINTYVNDDHWRMDMSRYKEGLYVVRVSNRNYQYDTAKFIVKR